MRAVAADDAGSRRRRPRSRPPLRLVGEGERGEPARRWNVLVVDDDEEMHRLVRLIAGSMTFEHQPVEIISAYSAAEARQVLEQREVAVVLLDIVMETDTAGLDFIEHVRHERNDHEIRIIVVTGQPGVAPEPRVIRDLDINGYLNKAEIESQQVSSLIVTSLRMCSDFRRMRDLADQARRAELASDAKSEFIAAMNHELRSPLQTIIGYAELMRHTQPGDLAAWETGLARIERASHHMLSIVNDILNVAAIERSGDEGALQQLNPAAIVRDSCAMMRQLAEERGLSINDEVAPATPLVRGDERRIKQALINLISNAIKYNRPDGQVVVSAGLADGRVEIAVEDTGVGIPEDLRDRIFLPFERLHSDESGTGIGLHITQRLLREMGTELEVASTVGEGSRFSFRLDVDR